MLKADPSKAKRDLGWSPKITFSQLAKIMVDADMRDTGIEPKGEGEDILKKAYPKRWWQKA